MYVYLSAWMRILSCSVLLGKISHRALITSRLRERLVDFREQYEIREKHFNSLMYSKDLELQLAHALLQEERQNTQRETNKARLLESQLLTSFKTERELREQLNTCETKLKKFEEAMGNSQLVFTTVQKAMENLVRKTADLEGINQTIRARHDLLKHHIFELEEEVCI